MTEATDKAREILRTQNLPGNLPSHEDNLAAAQAITEARYSYYKETGKVYPESYPPPEAGTGDDVFAAADENGEGTITRKELSKYLARNQGLRHRLGKGWESFCAQFNSEDMTEIQKEEFCLLWQAAAGNAQQTLKAVQDWVENKGDSKSPVPTSKQSKGYKEMVPPGASFQFSLGHQEMSRVITEMENIYNSQPCEWLPVEALANMLSQELGYEDVNEFEDALDGEFLDFVQRLPICELSFNERGTQVMRIKPIPKDAAPRKITFKITESKHLWYVFLQGPNSRITIPEIEFEFQPMGVRRLDTVYNHIGSAIWNLGNYVRDAGLAKETEGKILDTIHCLNKMLDVEHPFTWIVEDPGQECLWQPEDGVTVEELPKN